MKLAVTYLIIQVLIIGLLAITDPKLVIVALLMGIAIYGAFYLLCLWLGFGWKSKDQQGGLP